MRRDEYERAVRAGRNSAQKQRRRAQAPARESKLAALQREHPEWFSGSYFSEPVRRWTSMRFVPSDWDSTNFRISKSGTAARERDLKSDDPHTRARACGDLGGFPIRRFK